MVRMVDLVKGVGGDKEPDPPKGKKSSLKVKKESSTPVEKERPAHEVFSESTGKGVDTNGDSLPGSVQSSAEVISAEDVSGATFPNAGRRSVLKSASDDSGNLRKPNSLSAKSKYCPFLGGRMDRGKIIDYPVMGNVCYAEGSQEKKLLRTITYSFSAVPAQKQREFCLATYNRCPLYQEKEQDLRRREAENPDAS